MHFDQAAKTWDSEDKIRLTHSITDEMTRNIDLNKHHRAMEFACGTGLVSFDLMSQLDTMTLIDNSRGMIDQLNMKIDSQHITNMNSICTDLLNDATIDETYDFIYSSMSLHHVLETDQLLARLYAMLDDGGEICIVDLNTDDGSFHRHIPDYDKYNGFDQGELIEHFKKAGFVDVKSHTFYEGVKYVVDKNVDFSLFIMTGRKVMH